MSDFAMTILDIITRFLPDNFYLTWPEYQEAGCTREDWESMRDNPSTRQSIEQLTSHNDKEIIESSNYFNLVALMRDKFRVSIFETDDPSELSVRTVHQVLYQLDHCQKIPSHREICQSIIEIEEVIEKYKETRVNSLVMARLQLIASMPNSERMLLASMPSLTQPVKFVRERSGRFRIESLG